VAAVFRSSHRRGGGFWNAFFGRRGRVLRAIDSLWPVFRWDKLYIGGGNSARISTGVRAKFDENVIFIPNAAGMNGGVRAWALARPGRRG